MFQHVDHVRASVGKKLRALDGLEEYFWLSENTYPHTTMILAEVEGATTIEAWRDAPLWDPDSIARSTETWFRYLGEKRG